MFRNKDNNKRLHSMVATVAMIVVLSFSPVLTSADNTTDFSDVNDRTVSEKDMRDAIDELVNQEVIQGFSDGTFRPNDSIKRGQIAEMATKAFYLPIPDIWGDDYILSIDYEDMDKFRDRLKYVVAVTDAKIFIGDNNKFYPESKMTREQMASILTRILKNENIEPKKNVDVNLDNVGAAHQDAVQFLADSGITKETDDYRPKNNVTRAQFATFLVRTLHRSMDEDPNRIEAIDQDVVIPDDNLKYNLNGELAELGDPEILRPIPTLYHVTFEATEPVFQGNKKTSNNGVLESLGNIDTFDYRVILKKREKEVEKSNFATVTVKGSENTIGKITDYTLENDKGKELSNLTIVLGETVTFKDIKGISRVGEEDIDIDDVEFSSSDNNVAQIDNNGKITPISTGIVIFTLKTEYAEKEVRLFDVVEGDRTIKHLYTSLDNESAIKYVTGTETSFTINAKDQYLDPFDDFDTLDVTDVKNDDGDVIAAVDISESTNERGKAIVKVKMDNNHTGKGLLEFKGVDGEILKSFKVEVGDDKNIADRRIEQLPEYKGARFGVDKYGNVQEKKVYLNEYNKDGLFVSRSDLSDYTITTSDSDVFTVERSNGIITVIPKGPGTAYVQVEKDNDPAQKYEQQFTVSYAYK